MHNHSPARPGDAAAEMETLLGAYRKSGIGTAFAPAMSYTNTFVYGDNDAFIASLPPGVRETAGKIVANSRIFSPRAYFEAVDFLSSRFDSDLIRVHHGPMAPQWVEEDVLAEIKKAADRSGKMLFTHVQQTPHQYLYGIKKYGKTLIEWMDGKGLLGRNVVLGHCVWVTRSDIERLALSGTAVTHHPSCNLRVRNGIAPVNEMLKAGVAVGIGMDDKELGDDRDFIEEMRVASKLHRVPDYEPGSPCPGSRDAFRMATEYGARCLGLESETGVLRPGMRADVTLLDYGALTFPFTFSGHDPVEVLMQRGRKSHVRTVIAAGEVLFENGRHKRLDREEILRRLTESIPADYHETFSASAAGLEPLRREVRKWFGPWCRELEGMEKNPFYHLNDGR
jgi:cytosine/adenosine deaminase-related metal-dependent hydrolase